MTETTQNKTKQNRHTTADCQISNFVILFTYKKDLQSEIKIKLREAKEKKKSYNRFHSVYIACRNNNNNKQKMCN